MNRIIQYCLIFLLLISSCIASAKRVKKAPNVLIIFPDQMRRYSSGYWSNEEFKKYVVGKPDPVVTPNIDKLAENGVVFTNAISNYPLCSPYRGMMLTGMYPESNGIWGNCRKGRVHQLNKKIPTITDLFYDAGYNTSYFGKCHWEKTEPFFDKNGNYKGTIESPGGHFVNMYDTYVPPGASRHSIEYFYQSLKDRHFNPLIYSNDPKAIGGKSDGMLHKPKVFSAKNEAHHIVNYLKNNNNQRDVNKPFFMIWSLNPPHNPWTDSNTDMEMLRTYYNTDKYDKIDQLLVRENADLKVGHYARHYFANVTSVDKYVGQVIDQLNAIGELDNTIIIFSSDHGEMLGSHSRTGKDVLLQEALSIPFIVHWPKGLKSGVVEDLFGVTDVLPTVMNLAGLKSKIPNNIQGTDYSKKIRRRKKRYSIEEPELLLLGNARGIMTGRYLLSIEEVKGEGKLSEAYFYDNLLDPYQKRKLPLNRNNEHVKQLLSDLGRMLKLTNDPWYQQRKYSEIISYPENKCCKK